MCVKTVSYSIVVNDQLTIPFNAKKWPRQGDPLILISPFVCPGILAMEYLSRSLKLLRLQPQFKFHPECRRLDLIQLGFADDLLFCKGDVTSVKLLFAKFREFSKAFGLNANLSKSSIYCVGISTHVHQDIQNVLEFNIGNLPFRYLGVPWVQNIFPLYYVSFS